MILLTDDQASKVREVLSSLLNKDPATYEALAILDGAQRVEVKGWHDTIDGADLTYSISELMGESHEGLDPLYGVMK
jgi:hypothetical protein